MEKTFFLKKKHFLRIIAVFEADNEIDKCSTGSKTTKIFKQNPVLNGYHIKSELDDDLKSDYFESLLGYDNADWFINEVMKLENKIAFCFKNTKKEINMMEEDE